MNIYTDESRNLIQNICDLYDKRLISYHVANAILISAIEELNGELQEERPAMYARREVKWSAR